MARKVTIEKSENCLVQTLFASVSPAVEPGGSAKSMRLEKALLEVSDREQRRIGREIHDGLCQRLFSSALICNMLREKLTAEARPEAVDAARLLSHLDEAISEARALARGLTLANLDQEGLITALRELASATRRDFRVRCSARCSGQAQVGYSKAAAHLYQLAREAVHNAIRHAKPSRIVIRLNSNLKGGCLSVMDDGIGIQNEPRRAGMGLEMMRYRADLISGQLKVRTHPNGGTIVACTFPLKLLKPLPHGPSLNATPPSGAFG